MSSRRGRFGAGGPTPVVLALLLGCVPEAPPAPPAPPASAAPETTAAAIYHLVDTGVSVRLQREFRRVPRSDDPMRTALDTMFREPAFDPDYASLWPRTTTVRGISRSGSTATVDLTGPALDGHGGSEATAMSVQQLVYTATAAEPAISEVRIRVDGHDVADFWGHASLAGGLRRAPSLDTLAFVSVDDPAEGSEVGATFTASGTATVFEANVQWRVTRRCKDEADCGAVLASGFATASEGAPGRGTWSVPITLDGGVEGPIELTAFETSARDGAEIHADTKGLRVVR